MKLRLFAIALLLIVLSVTAIAENQTSSTEVRAFSDNVQCRAWLQSNGNEICAYGECYINGTEAGQEMNCKSTIPDYVPADLPDSDKACNVSIDKMNNKCLSLTCGGFSKSICTDSFSQSKIGLTSCQALMNYWFQVIKFTPQATIELTDNKVETVNVDGREYRIQMNSQQPGTRCPVQIVVNAQPVDLPGVSTVAQIPAQGIEILSVAVTHNDENSSTVRLALRAIPQGNQSITYIEPNITLWGRFLKMIGAI